MSRLRAGWHSSFVTGPAFYLICCNNRLSETNNLHIYLCNKRDRRIFCIYFRCYQFPRTDLACETSKKLFLCSLAPAVLSDNCSLQTALDSHNHAEKPYNLLRVFRQVLHFHLATEKLFSDCERQVNPWENYFYISF